MAKMSGKRYWESGDLLLSDDLNTYESIMVIELMMGSFSQLHAVY